MADYRAIRAVGDALMDLLDSSYRPTDFNSIAADFNIVTSLDFTHNAIKNGASLFMYHLIYNGHQRNLPDQVDASRRRSDTPLLLDLHFLITVWGSEASYQNELAGWILRVLEDTPILTSSILNSATPNVFHSDETVSITHAELSTEDLFGMWDALGVNAYHLSIPYVARVNIESGQI